MSDSSLTGALPEPDAAEPDDFDPFANLDLESVTPSTEVQREVWLASQFSTDASLAFNEAVQIQLSGPVQVNSLTDALQLLVTRHESLRATFSEDGLQFIVAGSSGFQPKFVDLKHRDPAAAEAEFKQILRAAVAQPYNLTEGPLFRAWIVAREEQHHVLVLSAHHIICDGWSFGVLTRDLAALYSAQVQAHARSSGPLPGTPTTQLEKQWSVGQNAKVADQYSKYCEEETRRRSDPEYAQDERWWIQQFDSGQPTLELPVSQTRPAIRTYRSHRHDLEVPPTTLVAITRFARENGGSLFGALLSGFAALLNRLTGQDDLVIGVPAAGQVTAEMPGLIGHCVNFLPLRLKVAPQARVIDHFNSTQSLMLDAFEHQRYTFGTLLKSLQLARDPSRLPLVSVMFNLDTAIDPESLAFSGVQAELHSVPRISENFEIFLNATPHRGGMRLECQYNADLFDEATIAHWMRSYCAVLKNLANDPNASLGELNLLDDEQAGLLADWSGANAQPARTESLQELLNRHRLLHPDDIAVVCGRARLTYAELGARVARLARVIVQKGATPGAMVGISLARSVDMLVAVLAALEARATFVPLDPGFPGDRLQFMIEDSGLKLIISDSAAIQNLPKITQTNDNPKPASNENSQASTNRVQTILIDRDAAEIAAQLATALDSSQFGDADSSVASEESPAYVLYTSGSSGRPKGVVVPRRALANFLGSMAARPGLKRHDQLLAVTTLSFDIAQLELLLPLTVGATVVIALREQVLDGMAMIELLDRHEINVMQATPSGWRILIEAGWQARAGFKALVGGESLPAGLAQDLLDRCTEVWNMYGPTETTIWSTIWKLPRPPGSISIGQPIANTEILVLDPNDQPCAIGVRGEICIAGDGLAIGYLNRDELTAEKFAILTSGPNAGQRIYRTGDLGRWRADGQLEHQGRLDGQIKLRGYRIELGEIESVLLDQPGIVDAVAIIREDRAGDPRLVAYVVNEHPADAANAADAANPDEESTRQGLKGTLPDYMIPQAVVFMSALPRLPNTKIDRRALPAPSNAVQANRSVGIDSLGSGQAQSPLETEIAAAMAKILGLIEVGPNQDFFSMGGHSLSAAQLVARLTRLASNPGSPLAGSSVLLGTVFQAPTAARLARWIEDRRQAPSNDDTAIVRRSDQSRAPLSLVQERLWFLERLHPGRALYNTPSAHRLRGRLNIEALERAFEFVMRRQDVLRTCVEVDGDSVNLRIDDLQSPFRLPVIDLTATPAAERESELLRLIDSEIARPIPMTRSPMFVAQLFVLGDEEHVLFFMPHHFVWDGWSFDLFYDEVSAAYLALIDNKKPRLPELPVSYGDYSAWQREWLSGPAFQKQLDFWRKKLAQYQNIRPLSTDYPRRPSMSGRGNTEWISFDRRLVDDLRAIATRSDATLFMALLSAFAALLTTLGSPGEQSIGIPVRGRSRPETEQLMGYFTNLLPLMLNVAEDLRFPDLLAHVKEEMVGAYASPDVPIEQLLSSLGGARAGAPLYNALFSFQDARSRPVDWGNLRHERLEVTQKGATEDFGLWLVESDAGLVGGLIYNTDLYRPETAQALRNTFSNLLGEIVRRPQARLAELMENFSPGARSIDSSGGSVVARVASNAASNATSNAASNAASSSATNVSPHLTTQSAPVLDPPNTEAEIRIAQIWSELLKVPAIERADNFFDLGGNSLLAMQAVARAEQTFGTQVDPRRYVFESLAQIANGYEHADPRPANKDVQKKGLLGRLFGGRRGSS